ncbi:hypothetical protein ACFX19_026016 [Malus domestica]
MFIFVWREKKSEGLRLDFGWHLSFSPVATTTTTIDQQQQSPKVYGFGISTSNPEFVSPLIRLCLRTMASAVAVVGMMVTGAFSPSIVGA